MATPYRHIIWDWNGTLYDDAWLCVDVMNGILSRRGRKSLTLERYAEIFGFPVRDYYNQLGFDEMADPFEAVSTEFIEAYEARKLECGLRSGAKETLSVIRDVGIGQSIVSSSKQSFLDEIVAHHGLDGLFSGVRGLDNHHAYGKTEIARQWLATLGLPLEDVLFVGDTVHDVEVAETLGVDSCLIFSGHQSLARLKGCGVPLVGSLAEVVGRVG